MSGSKTNSPGFTDRRGEWRPEQAISYAPVLVWPPKIKKFLIWLINYLFTWNLLYLGVVVLSYLYLQAPLKEMKSLHISWISTIFIRNMALVWMVYGGWHLYLYTFKKKGTEAKYNPRWPSKDASTFLWKNQLYDNVFWTCAVSVPIWTAYEVLSFWLYANGKLPYIDFHEHPGYFIILFLLIPFWRELHFYFIHRLIHWKPLYKRIHYLHHYNISPIPWSGLTMHPLESLAYFSVVLIHWIVPSHPLHFLFNSQHTALTPAPGHSGFEGKVFKFLSFGSYFHYLHHRLFECNYGEATIPLDKWFGIFYDGAQTQTEKMDATASYKQYRVSRIVEEGPAVKSIYLSSPDNTGLTRNIPGQHLTFRIPFSGKTLCKDVKKSSGEKIRYALRSYTISNTAENNLYRISVKRQEDGLVSSAFHTSLEVGDVLDAKGPKGSFVQQKSTRKKSVYIAAGIGITPILSMLKASNETGKDIYLFMGVRDEKLLSFKEEIQQIADHHQGLKIHVFFSQSAVDSNEKVSGSWHYYNKRLDMKSLKTLLPEKEHFNFYICGPEDLSQSLVMELKQWKGKGSNVYTETFGVQGWKRSHGTGAKAFTVHFAKSDRILQWDPEFSNILEFAESNGIRMEAGCMFGECGACSTKITGGQVAYSHKTAKQAGEGFFLPCSTFPDSDISIDA